MDCASGQWKEADERDCASGSGRKQMNALGLGPVEGNR
jgi:hypothetical protein